MTLVIGKDLEEAAMGHLSGPWPIRRGGAYAPASGAADKLSWRCRVGRAAAGRHGVYGGRREEGAAGRGAPTFEAAGAVHRVLAGHQHAGHLLRPIET